MRRHGIATIFAVLGFASLWWWSAIDIEICRHFPRSCVVTGCKEIDACQINFVDGLVFVATILGPAIIFYAAAILFSRKQRHWTRWAVLPCSLVAVHWSVMLFWRLW